MNVLGTTIGPQKAAVDFVYPIIDTIDKAMSANGYLPAGPITKQGVPLYIGRYYDPVTKKLKVLNRPKVAVNPYDWKQVYDKKVLQLVSNWNQFVRGVEGLSSHIRNKSDWQNIVVKKQKVNSLDERRYKQMV